MPKLTPQEIDELNNEFLEPLVASSDVLFMV